MLSKASAGKEIADLDKAVAVELLAPFGRDRRREPPAAATRRAMGEFQPRDVKPAPVEPPRAEDRIIGEALRAGAERQQPERRTPPA